MSFLAPLFLAGALAAAVPIVLHLLKREPEAQVKFSAVHLLRHAPVEHAQKRHLRELLLLALRVSALLLLTLAFARPFLTSRLSATSTGVTVVALDTSLSMSAPGQFEKALGLANQAIDRAGGVVAVITFAEVARVVSEPSADRRVARAAVASSRPGAGATSYRAALSAAGSVLRGRAGRIVVVTDLQASGWDAGDRVSLPASAQIDIADVGIPPDNLAVTAARTVGDRIVASIRNTGSESREVSVSLNVSPGTGNAAPVKAAETTISIGAGQSADVTFPTPPGQWAAVMVDDRQGTAADNLRYVVLDAASRPTVLVITTKGDVSREAFYIEQALVAAGADGRGYEVEGVAGSDLQKWDQTRFDAHTAVVLLSTRTLEQHGRSLVAEYTRNGGGVLIAAGVDIDGAVVPDALGGLKISTAAPIAAAGPAAVGVRTLAPADVRHPVFRTLGGRSSLGLVKFRRISTIRADSCPTLARFTTGEAALVECEPGEGRALVLASDLDNQWNDFPLHATFVPFIHEAMQYLSGGRRSSDYLVGHAPAGVPAVPGVAPVSAASGGQPRLVAVNVNPAESDASRLTTDEFQTAVTRLQDPPVAEQTIEARQHEESQHLWQYVLALMMAMLVAESSLAMRTA
jgi:hypothetical protein